MALADMAVLSLAAPARCPAQAFMALLLLSMGPLAVRSTQACMELGFSEALECSTCDRLGEFLPSGDSQRAADAEKLVKECQGCCKAKGKEVFKQAVLYVCPSQVHVDQDLEDFVKRKADAFKQLKVKYTDGARTTLQLLREGETEESSNEYINARGWKSDDFREFLHLKLGVPKEK
mmetsp:Transcript_60936/g.114900  ORF Transcript_60936/g.114900 Transcript_60936/m.114900 type:complete len:177 (+) Transcript_60936:2-532(+)